jgi:hypothetical protein
LATAIPLAVLGVAATVVIGCFFFSPRSSMASPIPTRVASPVVPSSSVLPKKQTKKSIVRVREDNEDKAARLHLRRYAKPSPEVCIASEDQ